MSYNHQKINWQGTTISLQQIYALYIELVIIILVSCIWWKLIVSVTASRFVKETVADSSMPAGGVAKVE